MKKILIMLLCGMLLLSGCASGSADSDVSGGISVQTVDPSIPDNTLPTEPTESEPTTSSETEPTSATEPDIPQYQEIAAAEFEFDPQEFSELFEIEDGTVSGSAEKSDARTGFSGSGYVTRLTYGGSVVLEIELPASQHYNITLRAASDMPVSGSILLNGLPRGSFEISGSGGFETVRFDNIYLPAGETHVSFSALSGEMDLDCLLFENSTEIYDLSFDPSALTSLNADGSAINLYNYLIKNYGKNVLSGQQTSQGSNAEIEAIYELTGRYPAIRFGELMSYSAGIDSGDIELAIEWAKSGGIVGYSWYWTMNGSVYQNRTAFDLSKAVTGLDVATMDGGALTLRYDSGDITAETLAVIDGIDRIAEQLARLRDEGIAVIFRPLPEACSGQFWWSQSAESYLWLYKLIYERMTVYHSLGNLIWVWNGQSAEFYPGDEMTDIISLDIYYPENSPQAGRSGINFMLAAKKISEQKMIAMSECSVLPTPDDMAMDKAYWSFCSTWTDDYSIGGNYMQLPMWLQFYNSNTVITRDEIEYNR